MGSFNHKVGDMILYNYLGVDSDFTRGRIIEINGNKALIEIGICHRKSEEIYKDTLEVVLNDLYPINYIAE